MKLQDEINKRKTFAIISHPDAGKTTLTEKFLLYGGAIQTAGAVKSNKIDKTATSDFMEIEKQRGISVATSVMAFEYRDKLINILDTPGHKDFAEDTYRTLTAVDSVILVVDGAKGVEEQTENLMKVCRMRQTPVMIFVNKLDRESKDPYDLLNELEEKLDIHTRPLSWPAGTGFTFKGVYNLFNDTLNLFRPQKQKLEEDRIQVKDLKDETIDKELGDEADQLREDVELIQEYYEPFDNELYMHGYLAPVFFGSAINNFGVKELLDTFTDIAPNPLPRPADTREVSPGEEQFSGFVFKIHANIDPKHRDRIAFMRVCSGQFQRNKYLHHVRLNRNLKFSNPYSFMARSKSVVDEAWPGDVIGLYDTGTFKIGDTITEGEQFNYKGIPSFSPEIFKEVINKNPMKSKQLHKGIQQLSDEGVVQLFTKDDGNRKVIGTVGNLQFDVIQYRLKNEYGADCEFQPLNLYKACWITYDDPEKMDEFLKIKSNEVYTDKDGNYVYLAPSAGHLRIAQENYPGLQFHFTSEFKMELTNE